MNNEIEENHQVRSNFVREIVQRSVNLNSVYSELGTPPKKIIQFWDNLDRLPADVNDCMETWRATEELGFERLLFDKNQARDFILRELGIRHMHAYDKCYHPAMQSDYFRLCYILVEGGCYIDVDDVFMGEKIQHLFSDGRLKIQPLCYDIGTHAMIPPSHFAKPGANEKGWIFYFNNNPLIACSGHPLIESALSEATISLEKASMNALPEIQSTTGPGNLTKSIFNSSANIGELEKRLLVLTNWETIAKSRWELSYRNDARNWRLSNCQCY